MPFWIFFLTNYIEEHAPRTWGNDLPFLVWHFVFSLSSSNVRSCWFCSRCARRGGGCREMMPQLVTIRVVTEWYCRLWCFHSGSYLMCVTVTFASWLQHLLQQKRLMYLLRVESGVWIHSRTSRKGWQNRTNDYLTNAKEFDSIFKPNVRNPEQKLQPIQLFQDYECAWKKLNHIFFQKYRENKNTLTILSENYIEKFCILVYYLFPPGRQ